MRIGLIAPPWIPVPPPAYGGTESVIDRLARGLVRDGHDVLLAAAANSTCPVRLVTASRSSVRTSGTGVPGPTPLAEAPHGDDIFKNKADGCEKVVLKP